jgi:kynurenine formamidase
MAATTADTPSVFWVDFREELSFLPVPVRKWVFIAVVALFFGVSGFWGLWAQPQFLHEKMIDLTHTLEKGIPQFSEAQPFTVTELSDYRHGYLLRAISTSEHIGTHIDAPAHFFENKRTLEGIPVRDFVGYAVVINLTEDSRRNADYELTLADLKEWEKIHGPIKRDSIVILRTGWESRWFRPREFLNKDRNGVMHFPGFSCEVVDYLAHNRAVRALGTDTLSIDPGRSTDFCAHKILLNTNKYAIEALTNLEKLPPRGATIVIAPIKVGSGSGAPARVFAWLP